jgi:hypothetical protein
MDALWAEIGELAAREGLNYTGVMEKSGKLRVCGLCLYVCPHGRQR